MKRTQNIKIDLKPWLKVIQANKDHFYNPFKDMWSYLYIYKDKESCVEFYNLQRLDRNGPASLEAEHHWRYLRKHNPSKKQLLEKRKDAFITELNEDNWYMNKHPFLKGIPGEIRRARLLRLSAGKTMPWHYDETKKSDIRVVCPLYTNPNVKNLFRKGKEEIAMNMPATGHFYYFDEHVEHSVVNDSSKDRYALVFTVLNTTIEEWDAKSNYRH